MSTAEQIRDFLVDEVGFEGERAELSDDHPLLDAGVLDSLAIVALVEFLEATFEIEIDEDDIVAERFETIGAISDLVDSKNGHS